jgi:hypothetical protein
MSSATSANGDGEAYRPSPGKRSKHPSQAARTVDLLERLQEQIDADPTLIARGSQGQPVSSPAVGAIKEHRALLVTITKALELPSEDATEGRMTRSESARYAANVRWGGTTRRHGQDAPAVPPGAAWRCSARAYDGRPHPAGVDRQPARGAPGLRQVPRRHPTRESRSETICEAEFTGRPVIERIEVPQDPRRRPRKGRQGDYPYEAAQARTSGDVRRPEGQDRRS